MTRFTERAWVVVVPIKRAGIAKSRLTGITAQQRAELARAFPADCVAAALACRGVRAVVAVTDDTVAAARVRTLGARVIPDEPDAGLNPALRHAHTVVRDRYGDVGVAVLSGDLPALQPDELATALTRASGSARAFLSDQAGDGTTLLTAAAGCDLDPRFGAGSAHRHRESGAVPLSAEGLDSVRRDVDTPADLQAAVRLGVGPHTDDVLRRHGLTVDALH
ncbi:MAG: 2-phospho-L-lactate guanylyltransferase [Actinomycetota bacterium]|nr:2-phospho-L-lactate guanylyltransferase [Actinomycetota bacterium]